MNERINELAQGCFEYIEGTLDGDIVEFDYKKFAELIVKECCNVVLHYTDIDEGVAVAKKYFGVEE